MKKRKKEEFEMRKAATKFQRQKTNQMALENKIKSGVYIDPKLIKKDLSE